MTNRRTDDPCMACGHPASAHDDEHYANLCAGYEQGASLLAPTPCPFCGEFEITKRRDSVWVCVSCGRVA